MLNNLFLGLRSSLSDAKVYKKNEKQKETIKKLLYFFLQVALFVA